MKRIFYIAALLLAFMTMACGGGNKDVSELPQIDVNANYPEKEICLQDVAEVSYIALDSHDDFLFKGKLEEVSSKGIAVIGNDKIYLFHPDGKARNIIDKKGQGPGEYPFVYYAAFDWEKGEAYVHIPFQNQMFVYSLDGEFKRQFALNDNFRQHDMVNGTEHLVMYKVKPGKNEKGRIEPPYRPITYMSKADGAVDSLSFQQNYHTSMCIKMETMDGNVITSLVSVTALKQLNGSVYLNEIATDTIYRLDGKTLEPMMSRTPSVETESGAKVFLQMHGITPRYYFLRRQMEELAYIPSEGAYDYVSVDKGSGWLLYDIKTGDTFCAKISNKDWSSEISYKYLTFDGCDAYTAYLKLEAFDLVEALEAGELSGELKTIAEGLKEDDNPVLMVMKFKE